MHYNKEYLYVLYQVLDRLNKYGFCLTSQMKYPILDDIGNHVMDHAVELVKKGHKFVYVMDNIDWTINFKVHEMRSDNQNKDAHVVARNMKRTMLSQYQFWIHQLYSKAGVTSSSRVPVVIPGPPIGTTSRPDQPDAQILRVLKQVDQNIVFIF